MRFLQKSSVGFSEKGKHNSIVNLFDSGFETYFLLLNQKHWNSQGCNIILYNFLNVMLKLIFKINYSLTFFCFHDSCWKILITNVYTNPFNLNQMKYPRTYSTLYEPNLSKCSGSLSIWSIKIGQFERLSSET